MTPAPPFVAPGAAARSAPRRRHWSWPSRALGLGLVVTLTATGCLSDRYRVPDAELQRQVQLPPEQRGQNLKVVQEIGSRRAPAVTYGAPYGGAPQGYPPGHYESHSQAQVGVYVGVDLTPGPRYYAPPPPRASGAPAASGFRSGGARPVTVAGPSAAGADTAATGAGVAPAGPSRTAPGGMAPAATPAPAPGGGSASGFRGGTPSGGSSGGALKAPKGNSTDDAAALAVLAVLVAAGAVVGAAATEGARYDGSVNTTPYQNVYLKDRRGGERVQALGDLTPTDLIDLEEAYVSDADGYGLQRLGRDPLNRKGFAFKLDAGSVSTRVEKQLIGGAGAHVQLGYFFNKKLGLLATTTLTGGEDGLGRGYLRSQFGGELQGFLPGLGPLHLGGFGNFGVINTEIDDAGSQDGNVLGAGGIVELELTTRLALMFRVGWSWSDMGPGGWAEEGIGLSGGLAIY